MLLPHVRFCNGLVQRILVTTPHFSVTNYFPSHDHTFSTPGCTLSRLNVFTQLVHRSSATATPDPLKVRRSTCSATKTMSSLHITKLRDRPHVNLLLLADGEKSRYCLIKSLGRLIAPRTGHESIAVGQTETKSAPKHLHPGNWLIY